MRYICVFCGSNPGHNPGFTNMAQRLGQTLVQAGMGLVYGGGNIVQLPDNRHPVS